MSWASKRILVVGVGGIGGTVAGRILEAGLSVQAFTRNEQVAEAVASKGLTLQGNGNPVVIEGKVCTSIPSGLFDYILLATQPPELEQAARDALPSLAPNGRMVVFQNGLCEERVAQVCGNARVIGAIVSWGASMVAPGVFDQTSSGGFQVGTLSGLLDQELRDLAPILELVGPVKITSNLPGARWSKLALNCCISSLGTLGGDRLGALVKVRRYRRLGLEIFAEVVAVAKAKNIRLEKVAGTVDLPWLALTDKERRQAGSPSLTAKHAMLLAVGMRYRRLRSSMLRAIESGRPPAVDFLNGEVVRHGAMHGVPTPLNKRIVADVHRIASGDLQSSRATLDALFEATR